MINHPGLNDWVEEITALCQPERVYLCNGSDQEYRDLSQELVQKGVFVPLKRPGSFWCHSHPDDVARVEEATFICSRSKENAGPTNNWRDPNEMKADLTKLFRGSMEGRTLYVIPYCLGPVGSPFSRFGVQITDSPYVVCSTWIMTRVGTQALQAMGSGPFVKCLHSVGVPLKPGMKDSHWPCRPDQKHIVHFPEERSVWSFGSGYGGNALLGKKSFALRIASVMARDEGWMAEHMLILSLTSPQGEKKYFIAAFPSQCGKTNLAMLQSTLNGWTVQCVGDDIAWIRFGSDGRLYAVNPEAGFFGVAPGTSLQSNPNAMKTIESNTIFTNTALTADRDVWWEGMSSQPPDGLTSWLGVPWDPKNGSAAHSNARFTTPVRQCPILDPDWENPAGVPISGIIFGGRRADVVPLVTEALNWQHGVFLGASVSSETTSAAAGAVGKLRHDPFAMLPFCGYNMADYFRHWLKIGKQSSKLPHVFYVNWFRKSKDGKWLWPGFGENVRVLKWMFERISGKNKAVKTPIGFVPHPEDLDLSGLNLSSENLSELFRVDAKAWLNEAENLKKYFAIFGSKLPPEITQELLSLEKRCASSSSE